MGEVAQPLLRIAHHRSTSGLTIRVVGELDIASAAELGQYVDSLRPLPQSITMDVSGLSFVDSTGLRALTDVRSAVLEDGGDAVALAGCSASLRKLLALTGLATAFAGSDD